MEKKMTFLRYPLKTNWMFYLLIIAYAFLIVRMTFALWFGDGINIFATYSGAHTAEDMLVDANYVYWSKTCFLFLTMSLVALNVDFRFAIGLACSFWAISLTLMFGASWVLVIAATLGILLVALQLIRREVREAR
jgi:hypothetical protein